MGQGYGANVGCAVGQRVRTECNAYHQHNEDGIKKRVYGKEWRVDDGVRLL